jgi:methanogenic corrinoid protein MtbC1
MTFVDQVDTSSEWPGTDRPDRITPNVYTPGHAAAGDGEALSFLSRSRRSILLSRVLEAEILPRLALARIGPAAAAPADACSNVVSTEDDTATLVCLLLGPEDGQARAFLELMQQRGATVASLYLGIIAAAARRLGELWEDDRCDFAQVTISLGRLQQAVRALSPSFQLAATACSAHADTLLLLPAPGEQHTLGLVILAEFFRREGWHIVGGPVSTGYDAVDLVRETWIDIAGFSIGSVNCIDTLTASIRSVRKASRNRYLGVMVGGPLFLQRPELVARVGADTTAADAPAAVRQARGLLAMRAAAD